MRPFELRPGIRRLFRLPLRTPPSIHADVDEELEALIVARVDDLVRRGLSPADARAEALRRLGTSIDDARHQLHHSAEHRERRMRFREQLESAAQDLRYAVRGLARRPAFTAVTVLTLAIGIGATTAIFSAVNVLLLRPLPYAQPDELMRVSLTTPASSTREMRDDMVWSYPKFGVFRNLQQVFSDLSLYALQQFTVTSGDVEQLRGEFVGARYLRTLGLSPAPGRDFDPSVDAHPGAAREVIISHALWQRRFNLDPAAIGSTIDLDREPYTIIGIAAPGFLGVSGRGELFVPVTTRPADDLGQVESHEFYLIARRKPGISAAAATTAVQVLGTQVRNAFPGGRMGDGVWGATARPLDALRVVPLVKRSLFVLFGAVGFVLLIACVNVASLLLGRANTRAREIAIRLAIGAGRGRLVRALVTESLLLAALGGAASLIVAWLGTRALGAVDPATLLRAGRPTGVGAVTFAAIHLDWAALGFTLAIATVVGLLFGLAPALHATRASLSSAMKDAKGGAHAHSPSGRRLLVVVEVALAMVLLAGSGLMIRSLAKLLAIDPGFDSRGVLTLRLTIPPGGLGRDSIPAFYTQLLERVGAVPGVTDAALGNCPPLSGGCNGTRLELLDRPKDDPSRSQNGGVLWASPTWFATMRVPLIRGRFFEPTDRIGAPKVALISDAAARKFWPAGDALGKRIGIGQGGFSDGAEIVGIVGDVRQSVDSAAKSDAYIPYFQSPSPRMMIFLRTAGDPAALAADVRRAIHDVAPRYPVYDVQTMSARAQSATAASRFGAVLLGLFAATALSLAVVGVYGVMSLAVTARTREIGIRIALGADRGRVQRLVVGEGVTLVAIGAVVGIGGALVSTRVMRTLLFDLSPSDPITYAAIVVLLAGAALLASWLPARRAARVDPLEALRAE